MTPLPCPSLAFAEDDDVEVTMRWHTPKGRVDLCTPFDEETPYVMFVPTDRSAPVQTYTGPDAHKMLLRLLGEG